MPSSILDVNTGTGYAVLVLASFFPHARIAACDLSPQMLCRAAVNGEGAGRQFLLVQANAGDLPYQNGAFDLVLSIDVLPHLTRGEDQQGVNELGRVLAPGGLIVLRTAALDSLRSRHSQFVYERQRFTQRRIRIRIDRRPGAVRAGPKNRPLLTIRPHGTLL